MHPSQTDMEAQNEPYKAYCILKRGVCSTVDTKILHDPKYLIRWELWYYSILRSCRIFSIVSTVGALGGTHNVVYFGHSGYYVVVYGVYKAYISVS